MTDEEIKVLAEDTFKEKVFFSTMLGKNDMHLLSAVFIPVTFLDGPQIEQLRNDNVAAFYEYYDKAGPRSINGYPMFTSMRTITEVDLNKVAEKVDVFRKAIDES